MFTHVIINYRYIKTNPMLKLSYETVSRVKNSVSVFCLVISRCLLCQSFFRPELGFISGSGNHCHSLKRDSACIGADQFCSLMTSSEEVFSNGPLSVSKHLLLIG